MTHSASAVSTTSRAEGSFGGGLRSTAYFMDEHQFKSGDRVRICRKVTEPSGMGRWIKVVEDGVIVDRRFGSRGEWIRVWAPASIEGEVANSDPRNAEWFAVESRFLKVLRISSAV